MYQREALNEAFPTVLSVPLPITFSTWKRGFPRPLYIHGGVDFVTDGVLIRAECISCGNKKKEIGSQRQTFAGVSRRRDVGGPRPFPAERETRVRSSRDCAFHYANASSN